jgi:uroporphyrinogen-III synthase
MPGHVILTRPAGQSEALARRLRAAGRQVELLPLLEIAPLADSSALQAALGPIERYAMVAFVSPNAIDAAFAQRSQWPAEVTLAVLGEGSRAALARHGVTPATHHIVSPPDAGPSDSEHLLATLDLAALRGREVLIVRGEHGRELMADGLRAAGIGVRTVAAYRRKLPLLDDGLASRLRALLGASHDWVITSSEALRGLFALVEQLGGSAAVAALQRQHIIVPHARIAETARALGCTRLLECGSGDERVFAALQS